MAVVFLGILIVLRSASPTRACRLGGLLWFSDRKAYWGPCCEVCLIQYTLRPILQAPGRAPYYELVCPLCGLVLAGRAFSLQALAEIEQELRARLKRPRAGVPLQESFARPASPKEASIE